MRKAFSSEQRFSNANLHMNHLGILVKCLVRLKKSGGRLRFCISNKVPGDTAAVGPETTL